MSLKAISKKIIDIGEFKKYFLNPDLSMLDILSVYDLPHSYADNLRKFARKNCIPTKNEIFQNVVNSINIDEFRSLYLEELYTVDELKVKYNLSSFTLNKIIHDNNLQKSKQKWIETNRKKIREMYGVDNISQLDDVKNKKHKNAIKRTIDYDEFLEIYNDGGNNGLKDRYDICDSYVSKLLNYFDVDRVGSLNTLEKEIRNWLIQDLGISDININDRKILNGKEIDFLSIKNKIGIELNGMFWHNDKIVSKSYHLDKTKNASNKGINLYHIFEYEWCEKKDIIKSIIKSKFGLFDRKFFARNCEVIEIGEKIKSKFLNENHLQGNDASIVYYGLMCGGELISCMTFGKSRFNKTYEWELYRFTTKIGYKVIGGASKLFKHFVKLNRPASIITYVDVRFSPNGGFYETLNFKYLHMSKPSYFYFNNNTPFIVYSKNKFQKHKLKNISGFILDESKSEAENMYNNNYLRIWDCGNYVYGWKNI